MRSHSSGNWNKESFHYGITIYRENRIESVLFLHRLMPTPRSDILDFTEDSFCIVTTYLSTHI